MTVYYRDDLGEVAVDTDCCGVQFCDSYAYFWDDNGKEYRVPVGAMIEIINIPQ